MDQNSMNPTPGGFAPMQPGTANSFNSAPGGMNNVAPMGAPAPIGAPAPMGGTPMMPVLNPLPTDAFAPKKEESKKGGALGLIGMVFACIVAAVAVVFAVQSFLNYRNLENNFDAKVEQEVREAKKAQHDEDEAAYAEREKEPNKTFTGPSDYGSLSFQYPKTWSVYISSDGTDGGDYEAYFRPDYIDSIENSDSRHALRFFIRNESFDSIQREYKGKVDEGELRSSIFNKGSNLTGMRYEGTLEEGMEGVVVIVKINDKTAILQTDARVFQDDFNKLIDTLTRNSD